MKQDHTIDTLLGAWQSGDETARDTLFDLLYSELQTVAAALLRKEYNSSLSTGDLVNEAVLKIVNVSGVGWVNKSHFLALAARAMRRVLVDQARAKSSNKRHHQRVTLVTECGSANTERLDLDALDKALIRLKVLDEDKADIVELRYFGGMSLDDIATVKRMSKSTIKRNWQIARLWLLDCLEGAS